MYKGIVGQEELCPKIPFPAMIKGLQLGVTTLEMDIVISKDKQAVVSQEPYFNHEFSLTPDW
jgi:glycerophosphoryl diester phosphodiesterase